VAERRRPEEFLPVQMASVPGLNVVFRVLLAEAEMLRFERAGPVNSFDEVGLMAVSISLASSTPACAVSNLATTR